MILKHVHKVRPCNNHLPRLMDLLVTACLLFGLSLSVHAAELQDPVVNGVLEHALVTRWIYNSGTSFMLFEDRNDLITQERSRLT